MKKKLYLAAPLFSPQERSFNEALELRLSLKFEVFLPQRDGQLLTDLLSDGASAIEATARIYSIDRSAMSKADVIFAVLDGAVCDSGVAYELGFCSALRLTCIGFKSDARVLLPTGDNPMIDGCLELKLKSLAEMEAWLSTCGA